MGHSLDTSDWGVDLLAQMEADLIAWSGAAQPTPTKRLVQTVPRVDLAFQPGCRSDDGHTRSALRVQSIARCHEVHSR